MASSSRKALPCGTSVQTRPRLEWDWVLYLDGTRSGLFSILTFPSSCSLGAGTPEEKWLGARPKVAKTLGESSLRLGGRARRVTMVVGPCLGGNGGDAYSM